MNIIIGAHAIDRSEHAKRVVRKINADLASPDHPRQAIPFGVPHHLARFPHVCDDCGLTYWDREEWGAAHLGCRGQVKGAGFS